MIDLIEGFLPYIKGLYTLPWILIGFVLTIIIAKVTGREKIDKIMKKIGLILLYFFVPVLIFRIFLNTPFGIDEVIFAGVVSVIIITMYAIAYIYAKKTANKQKLTGKNYNLYIKTVLTNQGRSSAFIGSMMLAIDEWRLYAAILMAIVGIALFAVIPLILSLMHRKESKSKETHSKNPLPWFLKLYPWYLIAFVLGGLVVQFLFGPVPPELKLSLSRYLLGQNIDVLWALYTAITIPAALYYVGAGIHPKDLKIPELKKLIGFDKTGDDNQHWQWVRNNFIMTVVITPIILVSIFGVLFATRIIPSEWFVVITINTFLPITSTNMFLIPYGIDKKSTAHAVTWTTIVCVPIVALLYTIFKIVFN
jgi:hypothetical protein